ncbi:hypothetical protein PTSG_06719 [Salpingoeca rosetta]|uniref:Copper transport protein n=1 Tax=Salpingoeca rosetta (strain ATCC 50818 / BSB-021) TaxID=946362 RepID=F2UEL1_SALR5|nr:uncharacterized protein PTSG_06719 [Salpingoeca rosetta]EGD75061.1 hypothetical protein PTSG_06719 [Salpingoeca rosetta]|eukprot:XP_004992114.1 hypothetical protein PTSG_06719 [Salpingoeca rosetta]
MLYCRRRRSLVVVVALVAVAVAVLSFLLVAVLFSQSPAWYHTTPPESPHRLGLSSSLPTPSATMTVNGTEMMMMPMYFMLGHKTTILFKDWETKTMGQYVGSCVGVLILAIIYEWGKILRADLDMWISRRIAPKPCCMSLINSSTHQPNSHHSPPAAPDCVPWHYQLLRTVCHIVHFTLAYFLMLIAMTYSVGLFVSMVLGSGVGYFLFMRRNICKAQDNVETVSSCH